MARNSSASSAAASDATIKAAKTPIAQATEAEVNEAERNFMHALHDFWNSLDFMPSAATMSIIQLVGRVALYAVGFVSALYITAALSVVLTTWGWPVFIVACCEFIALVLGVIASWRLSDVTVDYIASGGVSRDIDRAGKWLGKKFGVAKSFVMPNVTTSVH